MDDVWIESLDASGGSDFPEYEGAPKSQLRRFFNALSQGMPVEDAARAQRLDLSLLPNSFQEEIAVHQARFTQKLYQQLDNCLACPGTSEYRTALQIYANLHLKANKTDGSGIPSTITLTSIPENIIEVVK